MPDRDPSRARTTTPSTTAVAARVLVGLVAVAVATAFSTTSEPIVLGASVVTVAGCALLAHLGAQGSPYRTLSRLIAVGIAVSGIGDIIYLTLGQIHGSPPQVSVADIFWLSAYVVAGAAMLRLPNGGGLDRDGAVDIAVVFVVAMVLQWELALVEVLTDTSVSVPARLVQALYPTFDAAMLALVVRAVVSRRLHSRVALLIGAGVTFWLCADFGLVMRLGDRDSPVLVACWLTSVVLLTSSTWVRTVAVPAVGGATRAGTDRAGRGGIAIALLPLLIPATVALAQELQGDVRNPVLLYVTSLALVGLAYARGSKILHDETAARAALRSQERFAQAAARNSSDALALLDERGILLNEAPHLASLIGHDGASTSGRDVFALIAPEDHDDARAVFARCLTVTAQTFDAEFRVTHHDGHQLWLGARMTNLIEDPDVCGVLVNIHDISDRRRAEEELSHQAFHDGLTDLANRALLGDRIDHALRRDRRVGSTPVLIYLDLDGFKNVNDSLGHTAGDKLLREVAARLTASVRTGDTVARLGGDEFAMLLDQPADPLAEAEVVAARVLHSLADPIVIDGHAVTVSASLGIAVGAVDSTATALLRDADIAMYRAKTAGKSRWVVYDPEMRSAAVERLQLESDLVTALEHDQFALVYQPVIRLESDEIVGFEALLRWNHPTRGPLGPDRFIPIAEETGLIIPIGRWVLQHATTTLARWHRDHPHRPGLTMAVNVSARQLASIDLVAEVAAVLETSGIAPGTLVVEITETALIQDTAVAADRLAALSALGVRLAVDDFGTGYSSLSYLRQFPIDILKIDRSFIHAIGDRAAVPAIVRGLLDLGRTLQLETVAEGVELDHQRDQLRSERCDLAQGFLFSRPIDVMAADALLREPVPPTQPRA